MTGLDQTERPKALEKRLDGLSTTVKSVGIAALAFWWAGSSGKNPTEVFPCPFQ